MSNHDPNDRGAQRHDDRLEHLTDRLPVRWGAAVRWLRQPSTRWARIPAGFLFIFGGCLFILPILGIWMIPLGLLLLAEDMPPLRRLRDRTLDWTAHRRPHWFGEEPATAASRDSTARDNRQ